MDKPKGPVLVNPDAIFPISLGFGVAAAVDWADDAFEPILLSKIDQRYD